MKLKRQWTLVCLALALLLAPVPLLLGQADQGTITGVVQDPSGAVIPNANVTLTNTDLGQVLKARSDGSGIYVFSPIKIGNYKVSASAPNFSTTTETNLHLNLQQRLNVVITLKPGAASETVTVTSEAPLMQTQESSVGQTMDTQTINSVPLNGRNWVYIAQLSAGTAVADGSRGGGKGDFEANGQRAEENNFILDGVDNNANVVDFYNGASYVVNPPPDALAEFKVQTSDYSAEFGHSAGAVVNASIKSGTNSLHGSAWEYNRNTIFDVHDWNPNAVVPVPAYHENIFGATLGGPVIKNKIFLFGDAQATRVSYAETGTFNVPMALMRKGNLSEFLNPALTSDHTAHQIYYQDPSGKNAPMPVPNNDLSSFMGGSLINATALKFLNYYPTANSTTANVYNNYVGQRPIVDNTFQWDVRADWTIGASDTTYSRYSYYNEMGYNQPPLGNILDGGGFGDDGKQKNYGANYMFSETHVFSPTLTNEARFGFNYLHTGFQHPNAANLNFAASQGFGGIPVAPLNGGLPNVSINGVLSNFGSPTWSTTDEHENVYEIIDNLTKIAGNHSLKAGVSFENIRFSTLQPQDSRGYYNYRTGQTANFDASGNQVSGTGSEVASFLLDLQNDAGLSNEITNGDQRSNNAAYFQDDWRLRQNLTLNLGVRWEYFQPYQDVGGYQASFVADSTSFKFNTATGLGSGTGKYLIPQETWSYAQKIMNSSNYNPNYQTVLTQDGITPTAVSDPHLLKAQHTNFAPRIGVAWSPDAKTAVRAGFGIFYGGLESVGYWPNLGENYPFQFTGTFQPDSCTSTHCPTDGIKIASGYTAVGDSQANLIQNGFASNTTSLTMRGSEAAPKTPYTESWNLSLERSITNDMVATVSYVGNTGKHILMIVDTNSPLVLVSHGQGTNNQRPFPHSGGTASVINGGTSTYSALQSKLEKRMSNGFNLLATYTWGHSLDDVDTPLGSSGDAGSPNYNLVPVQHDYSQSPWDTRQRFTFNGLYDLPFGKGRAYLNTNEVADLLVGGWSINAMFTAQTGNYFTVWQDSYNVNGQYFSTPDNINARALLVGDPYSGGGTAHTPDVTCPTSVKNHTNWFNPCAFKNPWNAAPAAAGGDHPLAPGQYVSDLASVLGYNGSSRNQIAGPGFERVNTSIFKSFQTFEKQTLDFRADIFNLFNTPALGNPSHTNIDNNAGQITGTRSLQRYAPDSRFIQLSLRYAF
ncbi:MAG: carboxypeptidase regulatory-like domain-containing protein [Acidobacteriota bacterium]